MMQLIRYLVNFPFALIKKFLVLTRSRSSYRNAPYPPHRPVKTIFH